MSLNNHNMLLCYLYGMDPFPEAEKCLMIRFDKFKVAKLHEVSVAEL